MPDTYYVDKNVINDLVHRSMKNKSAISLIWKIEDYQKANGQVKISQEQVVDVIDKDINCEYEFAWSYILEKRS